MTVLYAPPVVEERDTDSPAPAESVTWLRFYRADSQLVLTKAETAEQRAEAERQRAERLAAQLQAMGVDPEKVK